MAATGSKRPRLAEEVASNKTCESLETSPSQCKVIFTPPSLGCVENAYELEKKVLAVRNFKLVQRLRASKLIEERFNEQILKLERHKLYSNIVIAIVDRYREQMLQQIRLAIAQFEQQSWKKSSFSKPIQIPSKIQRIGDIFTAALSQADNTSGLSQEPQSTDCRVMEAELLKVVNLDLSIVDEFCNYLMAEHSVPMLNAAESRLAIKSEPQIEIETSVDDAIIPGTHLMATNQRFQGNSELSSLKNEITLLRTKLSVQEEKTNLLKNEAEEFLIREAKLYDSLCECQRIVRDLKLQSSNTPEVVECGDDCKLMRDLAEKRLNELNSLFDKYNELHKLVVDKEYGTQQPSPDIVKESAPYLELESKLSLVTKEHETLLTRLAELRDIIDFQKRTSDADLQKAKDDSDTQLMDLKKLGELECAAQRLETDKLALQSELETLKCQMEMLQEKIRMFVNPVEDSCSLNIQRLKDEIKRMKECLSNERREKEQLQNSLREYASYVCPSLDDASHRRMQALEEIIKSVRSELRVNREKERILGDELELTGIAYEEVLVKSRQLAVSLLDKENTYFCLLNESINQQKCIELLRNETKSLVDAFKASVDQEVEMLRLETRSQRRRMASYESKQKVWEHKIRVCCDNEQAFQKMLAQVTAKEKRLSEVVKQQADEISKLQNVVCHREADLEQSKFRENRLMEEKLALQAGSKHCVSSEERRRILRDRDDLKLLKHQVNDLRDSMKCSSCHVRQLDTVITKCYHVFCGECLKIRLEMRQRKCPKCNANFGANDIHRIYLYTAGGT